MADSIAITNQHFTQIFFFILAENLSGLDQNQNRPESRFQRFFVGVFSAKIGVKDYETQFQEHIWNPLIKAKLL